MRTIAEHTDAALALARPRLEGFSLVDASGLALASPVAARLPVPPFANSAMDGFAVHAADLAGGAGAVEAGAAGAGADDAGGLRLPVAGDIPAGSAAIACPPGHAVRVMTGAPVPPGDDIAVIPVEQTDIPAGPVPLPDAVTIRRFDPARTHVRPAGCDVRAGDTVAEPGTVLDAATLAALVATGVREVEAYAAPRIAVISTGDELVAWPGDIAGAQIPNSNLPMLAAIAGSAGAGEVSTFQAGDSAGASADATDSFKETFDRAAAGADLVVTSGGVSAGAFDVVRTTTQGAGGMWFGHVTQRPGGPQGIGTYKGTPLLCLPGNPVAAFVSAHLYLVPLIRAFAGHTRGLRVHERPRFAAEVGAGFPAPLPGRGLVVPVRLDFAGPQPYARPAFSGTGSHRVASLAGVDGLVVLPPAEDVRETSAAPGAPRTVSVLPTRPPA